jgi:hypothetical protein
MWFLSKELAVVGRVAVVSAVLGRTGRRLEKEEHSFGVSAIASVTLMHDLGDYPLAISVDHLDAVLFRVFAHT